MKTTIRLAAMAGIPGVLLACFLGAYAVAAPAATGSNLVVNGSFEFGLDPGVVLELNAVDSNTIAGWTVTSGSVDYYGTGWAAGDGSRSLDMSGISVGIISQTVSGFLVGSTYQLSFLMAGNPGEIPPLSAVKRLRASVGAASQEFSFSALGRGPSDMGWKLQTFNFTATAPALTLSFASLTDGTGGAALDRVSIAPTTNAPAWPPLDNLVVNGGFEVGTDPGSVLLVRAPNSAVISGWVVASGSIDYCGAAWGAGEGTRALDMSGVSAGSILQTVTGFSPGYRYRLSFLLAGNAASAPAIKRLRAVVGTNAQEDAFDVTGHSSFDMGWKVQTLDFTATDPTMPLSFLSLTDGSGGAALDGVSIMLATNVSFPKVAPAIAAQPGNVVVFEGGNAALSVVAAGVPPLTYRWRSGDGFINGATNPVLNFSGVTAAHAGQYAVVVANEFGSRTSVVATLSVTNFSNATFDVADFSPETNPGTVWSYGWLDTIGSPLQLLTDRARVSFNGFMVDSWRYGPGNPLIFWNGTTNTVTTEGGQGVYLPGTVWVYPGGDVASQQFGTIRFTAPVGCAPRYRIDAVFSPIFSGPISGDTEIHLVRNGVEIFSRFLPPNTGTTYTNSLDFSPGDRFDFLVGRGADGRDYASGLKIAARFIPDISAHVPPFILAQPHDRLALRGAEVTFTAMAGGSLPLTYQWYFDGEAIGAATNSSLALGPVTLSHAGNYSFVVANGFGAVTSAVAVLTVQLPPTVVRVDSVTAQAGGEAIVPVQLLSQGNANALGFSLSFDPSLLSFASAALGGDVPTTAELIVNSNQVDSGKVGLAVLLAPGTTFDSGTLGLLVLRFAASVVTDSPITPVRFGDFPTVEQISDPFAHPLPGTYIDGNVTIGPVDIEGDVATRPFGDRALTIIDWVQLGRFVAGLDSVSSAGEFQRADCAPRETRGNGAVTVIDLVQSGRYAAGLDPLAPSGGPREATAQEGAGALAGTDRILSLGNARITTGQSNAVPVQLNADGGENALSFSLSFDPAQLGFGGVLPGEDTAGAYLAVNTNQAAAGRIGVVLALPPGTTLAPGTREVANVIWTARGAAPATATVAFSNQPVPHETSDVLAHPVATSYANGTVSVTPLPGPQLQFLRSGNLLFISWPSSAAGFALEASAGPLGSPWSLVSGIIDLGEQKMAIVTIADGEKYFRLRLH